MQVSMYGQQAPPPAYPTDVDNMKLCDSIAEAMNLNDTLPLKQNTTYGSFYNGRSSVFVLCSKVVGYAAVLEPQVDVVHLVTYICIYYNYISIYYILQLLYIYLYV